MNARYDFVVVDIDAGTTLIERSSYAIAQQAQIREDWCPLWQADPTMCVRFAASPLDVRPGEVEIRLLKTPTMDGAIGYHDQKPDGTPIIYVFVALAIQLGDAWTSVASHEVLEVLGDPRLRRCVEMQDGTIWDTEPCDRVEQDTYLKHGVVLSNFNTPECFEPPQTLAGVKYDFLGKSTAANQVRPGGYSQEYTPGKGWAQHGMMSPYRAALFVMGIGRTARRAARNPSKWQRLLKWLHIR